MDNLLDTPLVTIAIPCYNHEVFVQDSIRSVINQTYKNIEFIIIDDGSTDQSVNKIKEMLGQCEQRFTRFEFRGRPNKGLCNTLNEALEWAQGDYFCVIASDDQMLPEKTSLQISSFKSDTVGVFGGVNIINNTNQILSSRVREYSETGFEDILLNKHDLPASSQMFKTDILRQVGGYNPNVKVEDWDLLLRMSKLNKKMVYIPQLLINYRKHDSNISSDNTFMYTEMIKILDQYVDEPKYAQALYIVKKRLLVNPMKKISKLKAFFLKIKILLEYKFN
ncbi:glycosyltransferase [Acinetobacter johnsonii]|jgi:alpha-1,3-rhamnosyltransferase|uniref:glycosyltransferase family 2 protein n=1 Tax=Acinetobacter johnsonii TaxID=40214 RepID=UPI001322CB1B|nr:glycosyltransferase [Acinetobacter johnsonii]MWC19333.1 glycosyltransferase [Acinetobacter johnsonii]